MKTNGLDFLKIDLKFEQEFVKDDRRGNQVIRFKVKDADCSRLEPIPFKIYIE